MNGRCQFACVDLVDWPKILFILYSLDFFGRSRIQGYAIVPVPLIQGNLL